MFDFLVFTSTVKFTEFVASQYDDLFEFTQDAFYLVFDSAVMRHGIDVKEYFEVMDYFALALFDEVLESYVNEVLALDGSSFHVQFDGDLFKQLMLGNLLTLLQLSSDWDIIVEFCGLFSIEEF